jgi:hypothetical protein
MRKCLLGVALLICFIVPSAWATPTLWDYGFNVNGAIYFTGDPLPGYVNTSGFDFNTGLGSLTFTVTGAGNHNILAYFDLEGAFPDYPVTKDLGQPMGTKPAWLSWEIGSPQFDSTLFNNVFFTGILNNLVDFDEGAGAHEDIAMALGATFTLNPGDKATVTFNITTTAPGSGFYLEQTAPDGTKIYLTANLNIQNEGAVPEPTTIALVGSGLAGLAARYRRKRR